MLRVGLTGGLATGKTFVGEALAGMGCFLIQSDALGHQALLPEGEAYAGVLREFGPGILAPDRTIDRRLLAREVFGDPARLAALNALVHPSVIRRQEELLAGLAARQPDGIAVVEAAILVETESYKRFDKLILTHCRREQQIERAMQRPGAVLEEVTARIERQMPLEQKRKFADFIIDTSGSKDETLRQAREAYDRLRSMKP